MGAPAKQFKVPGMGSTWFIQLYLPFMALHCVGSGASQLDSPVEVVEVGRTDRYREVVHAQKARDNQIILTPDSCFFFPKGPYLTGKVQSSIPGAEFNGNTTFDAITGIRNPGQKIQWPVLPMNDGTWNIEVFLDTTVTGAELIIRLGGTQQTVTAQASDGNSPQPWNLSYQVTNSGAHKGAVRYFEIELVGLNGASQLGRILKVRLHGPGMASDYLLRARWRPAAIHGSFYSSTLSAAGLGIDTLVMEQVADYSSPLSFDFYSPITTSFGYYGSVFNKVPDDPDGKFTATGPNFSMWNYGRNADPPPLQQFSHLLGLGDIRQTFGGFNHEGTGVKPRGSGWPLAGLPLSTYVTALSYAPGEPDDVYPKTRYTGKFWHPVAKQWQIYAIGAKDGLDQNFRLPSSFIEVPGPPQSERTGQIVRRMLYRGWVRDTLGNWHQVDSQSVGARPGEIVNKIWDKDANGYLTRAMGGIIHREYLQSGQQVKVSPPAETPGFLSPDALSGLEAAPPGINLEGMVALHDESFQIQFTLAGFASPAEVFLYHGEHDGLTLIFEDNNQPDEWSAPLSLGTFGNGSHSLDIRNPGIPAAGFARLLAQAEGAGRYWSGKTAQWLTPVPPSTFLVGTTAGTPVTTVEIQNPTEGKGITYQIQSGNGNGLFQLEGSTGAIKLGRDVEPQDIGNHTLKVVASLEGWGRILPAVPVEVVVNALQDYYQVALFDFSPDQTGQGIADQDSSQGSGWSTGALVDHATGSGSLGFGNQNEMNRGIASAPMPHLLLSSNRESDDQTPLLEGGDQESTWFTFSVAPGSGKLLDFRSSSLAIDTFAQSGLGGVTGATWTLYFRDDGDESWTPLETLEGAKVAGTGTAGPVSLSWNLGQIGRQPGTVHFLLDPQTSGYSTNGALSQRSIGLGNVRLAAFHEPARDFSSWCESYALAGHLPNSDQDKDRLPLALEYALGQDPNRKDLMEFDFSNLTLTIHKGSDASLAGTLFQIQTTPRLAPSTTWETQVPDYEDKYILRYTLPRQSRKLFVRLSVILL